MVGNDGAMRHETSATRRDTMTSSRIGVEDTRGMRNAFLSPVQHGWYSTSFAGQNLIRGRGGQLLWKVESYT